MNIYQIILNFYDSDDGHYNETPASRQVHSDLARATDLRDKFNAISLRDHNVRTEEIIAEHKENGWGVDNKYLKLFTGDPANIEAVRAFCTRHVAVTYYTIETLEVV